MNERPWTEGAWTAKYSKGNGWEVHTFFIDAKDKRKRSVVAFVDNAQNAKLLAAAPTLYEALEILHEIVTGNVDDREFVSWAIQFANAAMERAIAEGTNSQ